MKDEKYAKPSNVRPTSSAQMTRREFIKRLGLLGGGIIVYVSFGDLPSWAQSQADFNAFFRIGADGRITCFICEKFSGNPQRRVRDWYDIAGGGLDFQFVPGASEDIWRGREPYVRILAEKLKACLEEAQNF